MVKNIYKDIKIPESGEMFEKLLETKNVFIERIVSSDKPENKEYIQEQDEWVILLKGKAELEIKGEKISLKEGDYIYIPSKTPHRVLKTEKGTIWLAVHIF